MKWSPRITALLILVMAWGMADPTLAWRRCGHHRYHFHDRFSPCPRHFTPWRHCPRTFCHDHLARRTVVYTEQNGWDLIKNGRSQTALGIFEAISAAAPASGNPRLGIAVAAADTGQLAKSVAAMRRALEFNPGALQIFEPEAWLKERLPPLIKKFENPSPGLAIQDIFFMQAAFYYLVKDQHACLEAVRRGKQANDTTDSALNLFYMAENDEWRF